MSVMGNKNVVTPPRLCHSEHTREPAWKMLSLEREPKVRAEISKSESRKPEAEK